MAKKIDVSMERITPDSAREILAKNSTGNRPVTASRVTRYCAEMRAGKWLDTGETIKFAANGRLLDGQHRLRALVEYGKAMEFMVARNVPEESFTAIDTGAMRSGADVLGIVGFDAFLAKVLATSARLAHGYKTAGSPATKSFNRDLSLDNAGIIAFVEKHPALVEAAKFIIGESNSGRLLSASQLTWVVYEARKIEEDEADTFVLDFINGAMLAPTDPVFRLREVLIEEKASQRRTDPETILAGVVKAWNKRRKGEKMAGPNRLLTRDWSEFPKFRLTFKPCPRNCGQS